MAKPKDVVRQIKKATRRRFSADEKIRIVLEGLRGESTLTELCRREPKACCDLIDFSTASSSCILLILGISASLGDTTSHSTTSVLAVGANVLFA
ncbi:MAG: hypothetical protein KAV87_64515 [Desulfobacteraceae bacterium]|nr:hypothetical protein [Desulfobacteraceae bacterium]